jgi:hypothetical protein
MAVENPTPAVDPIAASLADIEVPVNPPATPPATPPADPPATPPGDNGGAPQNPAAPEGGEAVEINPYIDVMQKRFKLNGIELEVPKELQGKDVSPDVVVDYMQNKILMHNATNDPFLNEYMTASKTEGFNREEFIKSYNDKNAMLNMPSKDFLKESYRQKNGKSEENPNGWTDEDIDTRLNKMDRIELDEQADAIKASLREKMKSPSLNKEQIEKRINIANEAIFKNIEDVSLIMSKENNIGGVPHTQEDAAEFKEVFKKLSAINPETGKPKFTDFFSDDKNLYQSLYLMWKATNSNNGINKWLSDFKEGYKAEILSKTGVNQRRDAGNAKQVSVMKPDDLV